MSDSSDSVALDLFSFDDNGTLVDSMFIRFTMFVGAVLFDLLTLCRAVDDSLPFSPTPLSLSHVVQVVEFILLVGCNHPIGSKKTMDALMLNEICILNKENPFLKSSNIATMT